MRGYAACNEMEELQSRLRRACGVCRVSVPTEQQLFTQSSTIRGGYRIEEHVIGVTIQAEGLDLG